MKLPASDSGAPLFLLGSGRCGSTFWQTLLCRASHVWIWGEHGGFLHPLLKSRARYRHVRSLLDLGREGASFDDLQMQSHSEPSIGTKLAWSNRTTAEDLDDFLRGFIDAFMRHGLPAGRTRWGFKEIRYGRDMDLSRQLLELFPGGHVIHALRHPRTTIESAMRSWREELFTPKIDPAEFQAAYDEHAARWLTVTETLLALADTAPGRVTSVRLEHVAAGREALESLIGSPLPDDHPRINQNRLAVDEAAAESLETSWRHWEARLTRVARQAGYPS